VLPAHFAVDLEQLRALAGVTTLRLATEEELARLYPDLEVGAMPPFGAVYGHRVFVERCLVGEPEMVFNAGTHTDAIRMHYWDVAELAKPVVGNFCRTPGGQLTTCASSPRPQRQTKRRES
jgi:Ala-tRNA(Pro) deacylase